MPKTKKSVSTVLRRGKQKDNYSNKFIILSLMAFLLFFIFLFIVIPILFQEKTKPQVKENLYINKNYLENDSLVTPVPKLADIITGPIISNKESLLGNINAQNTITIYTNFTCFFCNETLDIIKQILNDFPDDVKIMHKDYPSSNKSFASYQASIAGRCAQNQNKFWEMSDNLYKNFNNLKKEKFIEIANKLDLNIVRFNKCLDGKITEPVVNIIDENILEANALGIVGIPTVYINNREMPAEVTYEELRTAVEQEISKN